MPFCAGNALANVTAVGINSPTTGSPASVSGGASFPVAITYTADGSGSADLDVVINLVSGGTVVGSTAVTVTKEFPEPTTTNLTFVVTNCTLDGTFALTVEASDGVAASASQDDAVIISGGTPMAFSVTGGGSYCSGGSGVAIGLAGSEFGVNYQLKKGAANSGSSVPGTGSAITFGNKIFAGTYTVVATSALSGCTATMPGSASVTINPASVGGTASVTPGTVCSGNSATLSLSGQTGDIEEWQYTTDDGDTWNSIPSSAGQNPMVTGPLTNTTYFQALVSNGGCSPAYSSVVGVMVNPVSVGGTVTATASSVCGGSSTLLTLSGQTGSIVRWEVSPDGTTWTTNISTANPLNSGNLTATRYFRAVVQSGSCSQATSEVAVVTVNPATVGGVTTPAAGTVCSGSSTTISLTGQTGSIVWWESSLDGITWTTNASTTDPFDTGPLTETTLFRAMVQSGDCAVLDSSISTVTVNPASVGGTATATASEVCSGSSTLVTLAGQTGSIVRWEYSTNGTDWSPINSTANPLNTGNLTTTKYFHAVVQSGVCSLATSSDAVVTVSPPTVGGTAAATADTICSGSSTTITLSGQTGSIVRWEASPDGITWSSIESTNNPLTTSNLTATTLFRAMVQSGGCTVLDSSAAIVSVNPVSDGGTATATADTLCNGSSTTIGLSGQTGSIVRWETSTNGTDWSSIESTANPLNTGNLTATRYYRAVVQSGVCDTDNSSIAVVTVNSRPSIASQPSSAVRLVGASVSFSVTADNATGYQWRLNGSPVSGATASAYTIDPVSAEDAGSYDCVLTGSSPCAATTSAAATLSVGSKLVFSSQPVNSTAGATMSAVGVQIQDQSGNDIPASGTTVSLSLNGGGTLSGTPDAVTDSNGKAAFGTLSITKAGSGYTLTASSGSLTAATSTSFNITAATANAYRITAATNTLAPAVADALTLNLVDQFGNTITTFNGDKPLTFSGLSVAGNGTTHPTITDKTGAAINLGEVTTLTFTNGQSSAGGSLVAYKGEEAVTLAASDGTFSTASTGGAGVTLTIPNLAPVAGADSVARGRNTQLRILISNLLTNDSDVNADLISFVGVSSSSTNGASLFTNATQILYSPAPGSNPASDYFTYTISDGLLSTTGMVNVALLPDPTGIANNIVSSLRDPDGHPVITFAGIPSYAYKVQRSTNLTDWTDLWTTNAPSTGLFQFTDLNLLNPVFYRAITQ